MYRSGVSMIARSVSNQLGKNSHRFFLASRLLDSSKSIAIEENRAWLSGSRAPSAAKPVTVMDPGEDYLARSASSTDAEDALTHVNRIELVGRVMLPPRNGVSVNSNPYLILLLKTVCKMGNGVGDNGPLYSRDTHNVSFFGPEQKIAKLVTDISEGSRVRVVGRVRYRKMQDNTWRAFVNASEIQVM